MNAHSSSAVAPLALDSTVGNARANAPTEDSSAATDVLADGASSCGRGLAADHPAAGIVAAARLLLPHLERGERIDAGLLRRAMETAVNRHANLTP
jgi:hypothetical protein